MDIFQPIQLFADLITYDWLNIAPHSYWGDAVDFFIYNSIKIGLLLVVINYVMAITRGRRAGRIDPWLCAEGFY